MRLPGSIDAEAISGFEAAAIVSGWQPSTTRIGADRTLPPDTERLADDDLDDGLSIRQEAAHSTLSETAGRTLFVTLGLSAVNGRYSID